MFSYLFGSNDTEEQQLQEINPAEMKINAFKSKKPNCSTET